MSYEVDVECPDCDVRPSIATCGLGEPTEKTVETLRAIALATHRRYVHGGESETVVRTGEGNLCQDSSPDGEGSAPCPDRSGT